MTGAASFAAPAAASSRTERVSGGAHLFTVLPGMAGGGAKGGMMLRRNSISRRGAAVAERLSTPPGYGLNDEPAAAGS